MSKDEFLDQLQEALTDSVPASVVRENIQFYGDYIDEQERQGRSSEEIFDELGSPRLIAHTIIDTTPEAGEDRGTRRSYNTGRGSYSGEEQPTPHFFSLDLSKWYGKFIAFLVLFVIIFAVISIISGFLSLLLPVLPIILVVGMMMFMFGGHGR